MGSHLDRARAELGYDDIDRPSAAELAEDDREVARWYEQRAAAAARQANADAAERRRLERAERKAA